MKSMAGMVFVAAAAALLAAGCEDWARLEIDSSGDGGSSGGGSNTAAAADGAATAAADGAATGPSTPAQPPSTGGTAAPAGGVPADFAGVRWLHTDVSGWAQTASLSARVSGGSIILNYDKARVWPEVNGLNANPWVFVHRDGTWYAATFEWLRGGQTSKPTSTVAGDHIKRSPLNNFRPVSGETYGFMVSGLARDRTRNVQERSNVSMVRWP